MAVPTVTITGSVLVPDGTAPTSGTVTVDLCTSGTALDGGTAQVVLGRVVWTLGVDGSLPGTAKLVPNDIITPANTVYYVRYDCKVGTRDLVWGETWQLASTPNPIAIGAISRVNAPTVSELALAQKLDRVGGDGSAVLVTSTGGTTARTLADVARTALIGSGDVRALRNRVLWQSDDLPIPATPDTLLLDQLVDFGPFGVSADANNLNYKVVITKPDGAGGRTASIRDSHARSEWNFPGHPLADPSGYKIKVRCSADLTTAPDLGDGNEIEVGFSDVDPANFPDVDPDPRQRGAVQVRAWRTTDSYTSGQQAALNALGYGFRVIISGPDPVVWEREVPIVAAQNAILIDEEVDLTALGATSDPSRIAILAQIKRGGQTIRLPWGLDGSPRSPYYGEQVDPPTHPVSIATPGVTPDQPAYVHYNYISNWEGTAAGWGMRDGNGPIAGSLPSFGVSNYRYYGGIVLGPKLAACNARVEDRIRVRAWRPP